MPSNDRGFSHNDGKLAIGASYDGNGNLLTETYNRLGAAIRNVNYSYNSEGKLSGITYAEQSRPAFMPAVAGNTLNFSYDDFGNRIKKTVNGTNSYYINNGVSVLNELNGSGIVQKSIVQGLSQIAEIDSSGVLKFIHTDILGSTVMVTDSNGGVVQAYEYEAFGEVVGSVSTSSSAETKYLFTGQEYDFESELTYMNARYYSATLGRFIARDPVIGKYGDLLSRNGYIYVKNNPLKYTDPTGMEEEDITNDFIKRLKSSAWDMMLYINPVDWISSPKYFEDEKYRIDHLISEIFLSYKLKISDEYIDKIPSYILDELEAKPLKFKYFYGKVKPGGVWDLKAKAYGDKKYVKKGVVINGNRYNYDLPGNVLYGYAGAAGGFSADVLKMMGGLAQISTKTSKDEWTWEKSYYDDPKDQEAIQAGYDLYKRYGRKITPEKLQLFIHNLTKPTYIDSPSKKQLLNNFA